MMEGYMQHGLPVYPHYAGCQASLDDLAGRHPAQRQALYLKMIQCEADLPTDPDFRYDLDTYAKECGIDADNQAAYRTCLQFRNYCQAHGHAPAQGFVIKGKLGARKTSLQVALARSLLAIGIRCQWVNLPDLRARLAPRANEGAYEEWRERLSSQKISVLFLDEAGQESATAKWVEEFLAPLVRHRLGNRLPIVLTTIFNPQELGERWSCGGAAAEGSGTIISRLGSRAVQVEITGESHRIAEADFMSEEYE
jgi:DNA replication protein DnaC